MSLAPYRTPNSAPVTLIHVVPARASMVQTVNHVTIVYIRKALCGENLNVDLTRPTQMIRQISLSLSRPYMNVRYFIALIFISGRQLSFLIWLGFINYGILCKI